MADLIAFEHTDSRRLGSGQTAGEKSNAVSPCDPNGSRDGFNSFLGRLRKPTEQPAVESFVGHFWFDTMSGFWS